MKRHELERELDAQRVKVRDLQAQLASAMGAAFDALPKAGDALHGSAAVLTITGLGGRVIVAPVAIRDGLSLAAIAALQEDLRRSFELATMVNPAMARKGVNT